MNIHAQVLGSLGGKKRAEIYSKTELSAMGKLGGRPLSNNNNYNSIHVWLKRNHKKDPQCNLCKQEKRLQFAVKKGFVHKRDRNHYLLLCSMCHKAYDTDKLTKEELSSLL